MRRIARTALVAHPAAQLYALVEDVEAYPRFLPWCSGVVVHSRSAERTRATITVKLGRIRQSFTTENENRPVEAIDMRLVEGPFRRFSASWRFAELPRDSCRIEFVMEYAFASRAVAALLEPLFDRIANTMVDAFHRRADALYGTAPH